MSFVWGFGAGIGFVGDLGTAMGFIGRPGVDFVGYPERKQTTQPFSAQNNPLIHALLRQLSTLSFLRRSNWSPFDVCHKDLGRWEHWKQIT